MSDGLRLTSSYAEL